MHCLVTGGAGFIGSAFVRKALTQGWFDKVTVLDALTYAGNLDNLDPIWKHPGFNFIQGNICSEKDIKKALSNKVDALFHFAAESHVDRSIHSSKIFYETNILGTGLLLEASRAFSIKKFIHVSTDEVYGSLSLNSPERFTEKTPLAPNSPYAASKASSDLLVLANHKTHKQNCLITRCSNNYGPYQYPEKFLPLFITKALAKETLPLYGSGENIRDWIHVDAHVEGIFLAYKKGNSGEIYNLGGECEKSNLSIAKKICEKTSLPLNHVQFVQDRKAHDLRYSVDTTKAQKELGFKPGESLDKNLPELINWYEKQETWLENIRKKLSKPQAGGPAAKHKDLEFSQRIT